MNLALAAVALLSAPPPAAAFAPPHRPPPPSSPPRWTSVAAAASASLGGALEYEAVLEGAATGGGGPADAATFKARLAENRAKMSEKDRTSEPLGKEDLKVVHEDEHIVVIDKPSGVLSVPGRGGNPSVQSAVYEAYGCESGNPGRMVCHRLGMDTSGLMVFARTDGALRDLNSQFRSRRVSRRYEALVCGNVGDESGTVDLPLMMDYENPPYMTVSTEDRQRALIGLDPDDVGRRVLENEKSSVTEYEVMGREEIGGCPVTRLTLTGITGRTHQLNVHCAAIGHPIVGDTVYGPGGDAAPNGGLGDATEGGGSSEEEIGTINDANGSGTRVHAKYIGFRHPGTGEEVAYESEAPF